MTLDMQETNLLDRLVSHRAHVGLFKAGVALLTVALITIAQGGEFVYQKEIDALKLAYTVEATMQKPLEAISCRSSGDIESKCLLAKHEMKSVGMMTDFLELLTDYAGWIGILFVALSGALYLYEMLPPYAAK